MNVLYGVVIPLCMSLLFIPLYSEAQTNASNSTAPEQYRQVLEKQFFKTGNNLFDQGNYMDAISYYDKALQINSTDINVLYNKALALDSLGKHDQAISYYKEVLAINPNDTSALNKLNLTFNNVDKNEISVIQKTDQTLLIAVGIAVSIIVSIIVINLAARKGRKSLMQKVSETAAPLKKEEKSTVMEIEDKKPKSEEIKDEGWKGI